MTSQLVIFRAFFFVPRPLIWKKNPVKMLALVYLVVQWVTLCFACFCRLLNFSKLFSKRACSGFKLFTKVFSRQHYTSRQRIKQVAVSVIYQYLYQSLKWERVCRSGQACITIGAKHWLYCIALEHIWQAGQNVPVNDYSSGSPLRVIFQILRIHWFYL